MQIPFAAVAGALLAALERGNWVRLLGPQDDSA